MAFDPALYNLISIKDLATAFNPDKGWVIAIQDPIGAVITKLTAEQLGILLNGNIQLPDGVLIGLDVTIGNATNPKTVSVSPGQYRINNGVYDLNAQYNANINTPGASDRTDAILADDTGSVYYQPNYNGVPIDGTIVVTTFLVPADGSDINPNPVIPTQYAVMNALNNGDFNITGSFKVNGVPFSGSGIPPLEFNETDLVDQGDGFWKLPITLEENEGINWIKVTIGVNSFFKPVTLSEDLSFITDFETNTSQTIKVKIS